MPFRVSGKNIEIGEALSARIAERVAEALKKHFEGGGYSGRATVSREAFGFRTECVLHLDSGVMLRADAMAADAYLSADQAATRLEKRLRRYHRRLKDHYGDETPTAPVRNIGLAPEPDDGAGLNGDGASHDEDQDDRIHDHKDHDGRSDTDRDVPSAAVIAEPVSVLRRLSVSEAVTELDATGVPVMAFRHAGHGGVNLVYRRGDGHVGWIDSSAATGESH